MNDDFPFIRIFLIGFRYLRTVISIIGPDPLELVRTKFSNQPIPIFYQIINRPPPAISFLNNKTILTLRAFFKSLPYLQNECMPVVRRKVRGNGREKVKKK